jgi:geranylgeranyl pyrophosphate synthase
MERAIADRSAVIAAPRWTELPDPASTTAVPALDDPKARSTMAAVSHLLDNQLRQLEALWRRLSGGQDFEVLGLDPPFWLESLLQLGGKRLRPAMCHWGYIAAGGQMGHPGHSEMVRVAAAVELLHQFALLQDDVMDDSDWRRGHPAAHRQAERWHADARARGDRASFGRNMAVLLSDLALVQAQRLVGTLSAALRELWYEMCVELVLGQCGDLSGAASGRRDRLHAEQLAQLKSGSYTVVRPLALGATAAGATAAAHEALHRYGVHAGAAFALRDEVLGVWGDPAVTGKPAGDDLRTAKPTVLLSLAAERLAGPAAVVLRKAGTAAMTDLDVAGLQEAMLAAGIGEEMESLIRWEVDQAVAAVSEDVLQPAGVSGLVELTTALAWRAC